MCALWSVLVGMLLLANAAVAVGQESEAETQSLRERLTEREDENRVEEPWSFDVAGRPLVISGEIEFEQEAIEHLEVGDAGQHQGQWLLEPGVEAELFYSFGAPLSVFVQLRLAGAYELRDQAGRSRSDTVLERGEMWLASERIAGSGWSVEVGSLDFEDDRLWWWDEDLDAVRVAWEREALEVSVALAQELLPRRSDRGYIEPEHDEVARVIVEASWDWADEHALELFALRHDDHSSPAIVGERVRPGREDESDSELLFLGLRASGALASARAGSFAYWLDLAQVHGDEQLAEIEFDTDTGGEAVVVETESQRVRGTAFELGATWMIPLQGQPRLTLSLARGSGDHDDEDGIDRSFRQTGVHANEIGFGGVQRFHHYGLVLDPELSNLDARGLGFGVSILRASSLDLLWNRYRLRHPSDELRDAGIDLVLDETGRDLGQALDLVIAIEEWERFELELDLAAFKPGRSVLAEDRSWVWGGLLGLRLAF